MSLEEPLADSASFDFIAYFEGHRRASGWFSDRFGNIKRHFSGDFFGTVKNDGTFQLDETLMYSDGIVETRQWNVSISNSGEFRATSDSLIGPAVGKIVGNKLNMQYDMKVQIDARRAWTLSMDDFMFLQPDGSLHNATQVKKFGIRIGTVSTQYFRADNEGSTITINTSAPATTMVVSSPVVKAVNM